MLSQVAWLLSAGLVLQGSTPPPKSWISDVKAGRATLGNRDVRIEGDVVDYRSTSPAARAGFYRIIDASDPEGVLIRTDRLPRDGGALRVRARIAQQQPERGPLLLEELDQQRLDRRPTTPLIVGAASLAVLVVVTLHSIVDFSLQIPGVAILVASLLGAGASVSLGKAQPDLPNST